MAGTFAQQELQLRQVINQQIRDGELPECYALADCLEEQGKQTEGYRVLSSLITAGVVRPFWHPTTNDDLIGLTPTRLCDEIAREYKLRVVSASEISYLVEPQAKQILQRDDRVRLIITHIGVQKRGAINTLGMTGCQLLERAASSIILQIMEPYVLFAEIETLLNVCKKIEEQSEKH